MCYHFYLPQERLHQVRKEWRNKSATAKQLFGESVALFEDLQLYDEITDTENAVLSTKLLPRQDVDKYMGTADIKVDEQPGNDVNEMIRLVPLVLQTLREVDSDRTIIDFFRLVENESFPLRFQF